MGQVQPQARNAVAQATRVFSTAAPKDVLLIDVRPEDEAKQYGILKNTIRVECSIMNDPEAVADQAIDDGRIPEDKSKPIIVYCKSGGRAGRLAKELQSRGYMISAVGGYADFAEEYGLE
eukprot:CAMPEP_0167761590 /NCGR_PEP_ID=MMETSP0110_2-20121227/12260_1 /TAXON_ID=629695 /ORGANISM="Gymnochlora sp., Strain CCMP2014" /LENGTH=119 /DNA_ID=CAMNT_0007648297 /DNA_START=161 /DNA_END=520 /DNA_ORIENTATION=-